MIGICRLTREKADLRNSHIYPKFVVEWMKSTGSKYQRGYATPNKRDQDGYKKYLLSEEAEQLFGKREKWFAENIFRKYLDNTFLQMTYDENLFYFAISMLWRILVLELELPDAKSFKFYNTQLDAEKQWRNFLLHGVYPYDYDKVHLILIDNVIDHTMPSQSVDYYLTRLMDGTTVFNEKFNYCSMYAKFSKFIFWSFLLGDDEDKMLNTKINPIKGTIGIPQRCDSIQILSFIPHRIRLIDDMLFASDKQQDIIVDEILKNNDHYQDSELLNSMEFDCEMKERNKNNRW
ncbi:MAG: hypothetical protein M0Q53_00385 [Prolixibacteraceae bacterium]|jgi:hypothetical protein|nr:hypothetical protein [Prolixibacteraceae bacterium]